MISGKIWSVKRKVVKSYLPIAFRPDHTTSKLEKTARAIPAYDLLNSTSWTSYLLAILAI